MFNFFCEKQSMALSAKGLLCELDHVFKVNTKVTDTFYNNAKLLHQIIYNHHFVFIDTNGKEVTYTKISLTAEDKKEFIKLVAKKLDLDRQKLILALEIHHRTIKEVEKAIKSSMI